MSSDAQQPAVLKTIVSALSAPEEEVESNTLRPSDVQALFQEWAMLHGGATVDPDSGALCFGQAQWRFQDTPATEHGGGVLSLKSATSTQTVALLIVDTVCSGDALFRHINELWVLGQQFRETQDVSVWWLRRDDLEEELPAEDEEQSLVGLFGVDPEACVRWLERQELTFPLMQFRLSPHRALSAFLRNPDTVLWSRAVATALLVGLVPPHFVSDVACDTARADLKAVTPLPNPYGTPSESGGCLENIARCEDSGASTLWWEITPNALQQVSPPLDKLIVVMRFCWLRNTIEEEQLLDALRLVGLLHFLPCFSLILPALDA